MADTYTIPATGLGAIRSIALHELHGPTLARLSGTQDLPVTLHAAPHALQAQLADAPLGLLPAADRAEYPELDWLLEQGFTPEVTARITVDGLASSAALRLPRPGLLLPANNPPAQAWTLLPPGSPADAVTLMDLPDDIGIDKRSRLQLLTRLRALPDGGVEVYLGNYLAGRLPAAAAASTASSPSPAPTTPRAATSAHSPSTPRPRSSTPRTSRLPPHTRTRRARLRPPPSSPRKAPATRTSVLPPRTRHARGSGGSLPHLYCSWVLPALRGITYSTQLFFPFSSLRKIRKYPKIGVKSQKIRRGASLPRRVRTNPKAVSYESYSVCGP